VQLAIGPATFAKDTHGKFLIHKADLVVSRLITGVPAGQTFWREKEPYTVLEAAEFEI
jgi:hypothetical protein